MADWWIWALALLGIIAVGVGSAFLGRVLYLQQVRRSLVKLLGRREAIVAAAKGLSLVIEHLLSGEDDALADFAFDQANDDRRAVMDVASRMRITYDDLRSMPLPKRLWPVAEEMEGAARLMSEQAGEVGKAQSPEEALDGLSAIRMQEIREHIALVNERLEPLLEAFRVDDPAVYGGGLYI